MQRVILFSPAAQSRLSERERRWGAGKEDERTWLKPTRNSSRAKKAIGTQHPQQTALEASGENQWTSCIAYCTCIVSIEIYSGPSVPVSVYTAFPLGVIVCTLDRQMSDKVIRISGRVQKNDTFISRFVSQQEILFIIPVQMYQSSEKLKSGGRLRVANIDKKINSFCEIHNKMS